MKIKDAEKIIASRGFDLEALKTYSYEEWQDLWARYGELMAAVGDCPFTEAADMLDKAY